MARTQANRGKQLEKLIDLTNRQYFRKGVADVRKIPTPVTITGNQRGRGKVTGFLTKGEHVDYYGITADCKPLVFDAKETSVDRFELKNLHEHQFDLLKSWHEKGACAFLIVSFVKRQGETYLLPFKLLEQAWAGYIGDGPKSIPYQTFVNECELVKSEKGFYLHYLKPVTA